MNNLQLGIAAQKADMILGEKAVFGTGIKSCALCGKDLPIGGADYCRPCANEILAEEIEYYK